MNNKKFILTKDTLGINPREENSFICDGFIFPADKASLIFLP